MVFCHSALHGVAAKSRSGYASGSVVRRVFSAERKEHGKPVWDFVQLVCVAYFAVDLSVGRSYRVQKPLDDARLDVCVKYTGGLSTRFGFVDEF